MNNRISLWLAVMLAFTITACGGGSSIDGSETGGNDSGTTPEDAIVTVNLSFWDCPDPNANSIDECTATEFINSASPAVIQVVITNDSATVDRQVVTVSSDKGVLSPADGKVLTNASGEAYIRLLAGTDEGIAEVSASYGDESDTSFLEIGSAEVSLAITSTLTVGEALAEGATLAVSAEVTSNGELFQSPVTVNFSSACALQARATIDEEVTAVGGIATATYRATGCEAQDTIDANVTVGANTATAVLTIALAEATASGIQYTSAEPEYITLQGAGGRSSSEVTFTVSDENGNPVQGVDVDFELFTNAGGTAIPAEKISARSDSEGKVRTTVVAGTIPGSARVQASLTTADGSIFTTVSSTLSIGTGFPTISNFSLSASQLNPVAWDFDGREVSVNIRVADHFGNPVPDGFAVSFITEGGRIEPRCLTVNGVCSVLWESQDYRPNDGRVTILAYAQGEESFTDMNGDGVFTGSGEFFIDVNVNGIQDGNDIVPDLPEAFVDYNEDGVRGATEQFIDRDLDGAYTDKDGQFNGLLCGGSGCSSEFVDVYSNITLQMAKRGSPTMHICGDSLCTLNGRANAGGGGLVHMCIYEEFQTKDGGIMRTPMGFETTVSYAPQDPVEINGAASQAQPNTNAVIHADASNVIVPARDINTEGCPSSAIFSFSYSGTGFVDVTASYTDGTGVAWTIPVGP